MLRAATATAAALLCTGCLRQAAVSVPSFRATECGASLAMPSTPQTESRTVNLASGPVTVNQYRAVRNAVTYGLVCTSDTSIKSDDSSSLTDQAQAAMLAANHASLASTHAVVAGEHRGREVLASAGAIHYRVRFFVLAGRTLNVSVIGSRDAVEAPTSDTFLDSLLIDHK